MYEIIALLFFMVIVILTDYPNWVGYIAGIIVTFVIMSNEVENRFISYKTINEMNITIDKPEYRIWLEKQKIKDKKWKNFIYQNGGTPDYPTDSDDGGYTSNGDSAT